MTGIGAPDPLLPRRALVTGGASGIGWAICRALAGRGVACAIADIDLDGARRRAAELGAAHHAIGIDLAETRQAAALPASAAREMGGLDLVVNNAGVTDISGRRMGQIQAAAFDRVVAVNLEAVEAVARSALSVMPPGGVIVNLASGAAFRPVPMRGAYSATKAGVVALTETFDRVAAGQGQRVSAVAPGFVRTDLVKSLIAAGRLDPEAVSARVPLGRLARPEEIAAAVIFLVSPAGAVLAGRCLVVDGGSGAVAGSQPVRSGAVVPRRAGPVVLIGDPPQELADRLALRAGILAIESETGLAGLPPPVAIIDARGLSRSSASAALARLHRLAASIESLDDCAGLSGLQLVRAGDPVAEAAIEMAVRTMAVECGTRGIRFNAIVWEGDTPDGLDMLALWLAGPEAGYVTGQSLRAGAPRPVAEPYRPVGPAPVRAATTQ